jgi:hypothetical protein
VRRLIRLYPRAWRARYGDEFTQLVDDLAGAAPDGRPTVDRRLALDIGRGALDAHWRGRIGMRLFTDPALRRGLYDGLILAALIAIDVLLSVVVFPAGPEESDSDPEYIIQNLATFAVLALLLMAIGARGRRRTECLTARGGATTRAKADATTGARADRTAGATAGARAGAAAGVVTAVLVTLTYLVVNNVWFSLVSQQHDKRIAFARSGWTSMRSYINVVQLEGLIALVPLLGIGGAVLGLAGAWLFHRPTRPANSARSA